MAHSRSGSKDVVDRLYFSDSSTDGEHGDEESQLTPAYIDPAGPILTTRRSVASPDPAMPVIRLASPIASPMYSSDEDSEGDAGHNRDREKVKGKRALVMEDSPSARPSYARGKEVGDGEALEVVRNTPSPPVPGGRRVSLASKMGLRPTQPRSPQPPIPSDSPSRRPPLRRGSTYRETPSPGLKLPSPSPSRQNSSSPVGESELDLDKLDPDLAVVARICTRHSRSPQVNSPISRLSSRARAKTFSPAPPTRQQGGHGTAEGTDGDEEKLPYRRKTFSSSHKYEGGDNEVPWAPSIGLTSTEMVSGGAHHLPERRAVTRESSPVPRMPIRRRSSSDDVSASVRSSRFSLVNMIHDEDSKLEMEGMSSKPDKSRISPPQSSAKAALKKSLRFSPLGVPMSIYKNVKKREEEKALHVQRHPEAKHGVKDAILSVAKFTPEGLLAKRVARNEALFEREEDKSDESDHEERTPPPRLYE